MRIRPFLWSLPSIWDLVSFHEEWDKNGKKDEKLDLSQEACVLSLQLTFVSTLQLGPTTNGAWDWDNEGIVGVLTRLISPRLQTDLM